VPVVPGVTVGGRAAFKASIKRGEDRGGAVVYDLAIGADVAASAGVGAGFAGAGLSSGRGAEMIWRFSSTHDVARAVRSMAILLAVGPRLEVACLALDSQIESIDRAIDGARRAADNVRQFVRSWMPWRDNAFIQSLRQRCDELTAKRRELVDGGRRILETLISWVATERIFLITHQQGYELRSTCTLEGTIGTPGLGDAAKGGATSLANLGASLSSSTERQYALRVEFARESKALFYEQKAVFTKTLSGAAGIGIGAAGSAKRVLEISQKLEAGTDGVHLQESGTTVKLALDGKLLAVLGIGVVGQAGVGGEVAVELRLADLLRYSANAVSILMGDDTHKAAALLRAIPIKVRARGRYEASVGVGIGLEVEGAFKRGIGGTVALIDWQPGYEYKGGGSNRSLAELLSAGPLRSGTAGFEAKLQEVSDEVARVLRD
jgi:hypothetical protein